MAKSRLSELRSKFNFNTVDFYSKPPSELKNETIQNWIKDPCGANYSSKEKLSKSYFNQIESSRYFSHPWMLDNINSFEIEGKKVLEIGFGMGTDHLALARNGAIMYGIDMGITNNIITKNRFKLFGYKTQLTLGDAEFLPFKDSCMDFIYSFGVVHHSPDTQKIISEAYRILKPGGQCYFAVYNKNSIFFWWSVFFLNFLIGQGWQERTLRQQISRVEYPNTNEDIVVKLYNKNQFKSHFKSFSQTSTAIAHLIPDDILYVRNFFKNPLKPRFILNWLGKKFGWYIIIKAIK